MWPQLVGSLSITRRLVLVRCRIKSVDVNGLCLHNGQCVCVYRGLISTGGL